MGQKKKPIIGEVVDLFCGVGALSHGLKRAGFDILAGYDTDENCKYAFEKNNNSSFFARDVSELTPAEIKSHFTGRLPSVLAGCAPCQPFSTYKQRYAEDPQWGLVTAFANLAAEVQPDFITMENVPTLVKYKDGAVFSEFVTRIREAGYRVQWSVVKCELFGVPQRRRRLVFLASKNLNLPPLAPTSDSATTVREAIGWLPKIDAGQEDPQDPLHTSSALSALNLKRIRASKPGGTWRDWPKKLVAECHKRPTGTTYPGVYARMSWDEPSPTMTTQCYGYGNGRFGHPEQDRAISLREAAILQSFPPDYEFFPPAQKPQFKQVGRWIGNAVPVKLAEAIGELIASTGNGTDNVKNDVQI